jgi:hypothetical protein
MLRSLDSFFAFTPCFEFGVDVSEIIAVSLIILILASLNKHENHAILSTGFCSAFSQRLTSAAAMLLPNTLVALRPHI